MLFGRNFALINTNIENIEESYMKRSINIVNVHVT